ncbi:thioredoxin domain-containing protein [Stappia sp. MMSF_3263]|uniref:thioredoxin domain-containing protein n=1 Tax=Stappia sp. MMSF_3263 TaxID=3046693 RepID=UPI00273DD3D7|nr:thioredoxin domain-containing protein [Stappia sp. MMSF_3263]
MTDNRLGDATSPYLLQHKDNPVAWRVWGSEALAEARETGKPILLSVGYAACHWCHVMAHESFEDEEVAEVMNRLFVNIKVDREERPDIDQIYMSALHALGEQGGWPLTMFLTSEAEPFWGGTYFPKTARWGRPGFVDVLEAISATYHSDRSRIDTNRKNLMHHLAQGPRSGEILHPGLAVLAGERLAGLLDSENGGIRGAPKFPQAPVMDLVWRAALRSGQTDMLARCIHTLERMSNGGIYDHVGGGLARYSVDERWLVPHFEKMLYDNAQYVAHLSRAISLDHLDTALGGMFRRRLDDTVGWMIREMLNSEAFAASLDADSEGVEGKFYVWTPDEVAAVLGPEDCATFIHAYDITSTGNFEGASIPNRLASGPDPADEEKLAPLRARLLAARETRVRPGRDDKILADWNGHAIAALAQAAHLSKLHGVSRESWRGHAVAAYTFVMQTMHDGRGALAHAWRDGRLTRPGFASDHACMMRAALSLAETASEASESLAYLRDAEHLADALERDFLHEGGGYYLSSVAADDLILRPYSPLDEAVPNANAIAAEALARLWHLTGDDRYRVRCDAILGAFAGEIPVNAFGTAGLLSAIDTRENAVLAVIVSPDGAAAAELDKTLSGRGDPALLRLLGVPGQELAAGHPLHGKAAKDGKPTLYLCREGTCSAPITDPADIDPALDALRSSGRI